MSTDSQTTTSAVLNESKIGKAHFPRKMLIFTAVIVSMICAAFLFISELDDLLGVGLDIVMVITLFVTVIVVIMWAVWFVFLSRWKWPARIFSAVMVIGLPMALLAIFRPVLGGDVNFVGFRPIWEAAHKAPPANVVVAAEGVDIKSESPIDFPRFLGPNQNATVVMPQGIDESKFEASTLLWKQPIGQGWSGFVARNGFAVTMEQRQDKECVTCYEIATGKLKWIYTHESRHQDKMNLGKVGPRSTPIIEDGRIYAIGAVGNFVCLNGADGTLLWQVNLNELLGVTIKDDVDEDGIAIQYEENSAVAWGRSGSPLIVGDLVVVPGGGPIGGQKKTLLAFDQITGDLRWSGGDEMIAYGSPTLATVTGVEQILMVAETKAMGFNPETGEVLWTYQRAGETNGGANTSQLSVVSDSQVLTSKGYPDGGGTLINLANDGGKISASKLWENSLVLKTKLTSPVLFRGHSYALSNGFLECVSIDNGKRIWKHRGRFGHGQLLLVNNLLLLHSESGMLYLIAPGDNTYQDLGSISTIDGVCWNTLCLYGDKLLIRSDMEAACVQLPLK